MSGLVNEGLHMRFIHIAAAAAFGLLTAGSVEAMPIAAAPVAQDSSSIVLARAGCGFGEHRGTFGGCRLNRGPRGKIRRAISGAPRGCPPGLHRVRGICRR